MTREENGINASAELSEAEKALHTGTGVATGAEHSLSQMASHVSNARRAENYPMHFVKKTGRT
jgi:hypothetical protein